MVNIGLSLDINGCWSMCVCMCDMCASGDMSDVCVWVWWGAGYGHALKVSPHRLQRLLIICKGENRDNTVQTSHTSLLDDKNWLGSRGVDGLAPPAAMPKEGLHTPAAVWLGCSAWTQPKGNREQTHGELLVGIRGAWSSGVAPCSMWLRPGSCRKEEGAAKDFRGAVDEVEWGYRLDKILYRS